MKLAYGLHIAGNILVLALDASPHKVYRHKNDDSDTYIYNSIALAHQLSLTLFGIEALA